MKTFDLLVGLGGLLMALAGFGAVIGIFLGSVAAFAVLIFQALT